MKKLSRAAALALALILALAACGPAEEPENFQPISVSLAESYSAGTEADLTPIVAGGYTLAGITVERDGTELVKDPPGNKYAFPSAGEYTVTYTAVNADKTKTLAVKVTVTENPNACPIASRLPAEAYAYTPLDLTPIVTGGYALRKPRGIVVYRGEAELAADPAENTYAFPDTGAYRVVYAAVKDGDSKTLEAAVNAVEPPGLQPVKSGWLETCYVNETVSLAPVVEYGYALKSPGGLVIKKDGVEAAADPEGLSYAFTETGEYTLTYTVSKAGESDKARTVTVSVTENAALQPISANLAAEYAAGDTVDLTPTLTDGYALTRVEVFKAGESVAENPAGNAFTFAEAGSYSVAYTAAKNGSVKSRTYDLVVTAPPQVDPIRFEAPDPLFIFTELDLTPELSNGYRLAEEGGIAVKRGGETLAVDPAGNRFTFEEFGAYTVVFKAVKAGAPDAEKSVTLTVTENEALMPVTAPDTSDLFYNVAYDLTPTLSHGYALVFLTVERRGGGGTVTVPENGIFTFLQPDEYTLAYTARRGPSVKTLTARVQVRNAVFSALQPGYFIGTPLNLAPSLAEGWTADGLTVTDAAGGAVAVEDAANHRFAAGGAYTVSYAARNAAGDRNTLEVKVYIDEFESAGGYSVDKQTGVRTLTGGGERWNDAYYYADFEGDYLFTVTLRLAEEAGPAAKLPKVGVIAGEDAAGNGVSFLLDPSQTASETAGEVASCLIVSGVRGAYAQCLLDSALSSAGGLTHAAEYALTIVRSGNVFYFFVNGVLYQAREAALSGEVRVGYAAFARGGVFADFAVRTDANAIAERVRAAGTLAPNGSYANFTQMSHTDTSVAFEADASVATGRGAAKTQVGVRGVTMHGDFDLTTTIEGLVEMPKNATTVRRIRINLIREDGSKDAVALSARFDNGVLGVQFLSAEGNGALQPEVIANNLVKNFKNDPAYSVARETYALKIRRRIADGKAVLSASVNGVELAQTSASNAASEILYTGAYRLGLASDDWGGTVRDYAVSYNPATVPADQAVAPGDTVRLAPLSLAEGWSCGIAVFNAAGTDVTDLVYNRETQAFLSETAGVYNVNYTCTLLVDPKVKRVYTVTVTVREFARPEIVLTGVVTEGLTGEAIPVTPSVAYGGAEPYTVEVAAECGGAPVALSGSWEGGDLALSTLLPGEYTVRIAVDFQGETIADSYTVTVSSLGKLEDTSGQTANEGIRYTVSGALNKNAANTLAFLDGQVAGANELRFNVGNASLNWVPGAKPQAAGNTAYMPVMVVYAREDGLFDLVALDFSTAKLCGANNIGVAAENGGFITLRLYVGAETPAVSPDDPGWEIWREPAALGSAGGLKGVMASIQRHIVYAQDTTGTYGLRAAYNVTFNHAATVTDHTFEATSPASGRVTLGLAAANTDVILRNILVCETVQSALPVSLPAGQETDLTAGLTAAAGWTITENIWVLGADGAAVEVVDPQRFAFSAPGAYAVEVRATAKLSNTTALKAAVFTVLITVTA